MDQHRKFERAKAALIVELPELKQVATAVLAIAERLYELDDARLGVVAAASRESLETVVAPARKIVDGLQCATLQTKRKFRRKARVALSDFRAAVEFIEAALTRPQNLTCGTQ